MGVRVEVEATDLCESLEKLAEGPGNDIEGIICKLDKGIDGTLGGWIALDHVQGKTRVDGQLRGGNIRREGARRVKKETDLVLYSVDECLHVFLLGSC